MPARMNLRRLRRLDDMIKSTLVKARIPGAAIAIVSGEETIYARGFGHRDLKRSKPVTAQTVYPIASASKAMNATLLGMLVEEGRVEWDAPVQRYLPHFRLQDAAISPRVTVRDLVAMRTGLPRHDWVWIDNRTSRAELVRCLAHLDLSADFRQRFQYSNLSATAAGHVAEAVTGRSWETLARERILAPLRMRATTCVRPARGNVTASFHETTRRKLVPSWRFAAAVTAPAGGAIHSTVVDMTRWLALNLRSGRAGRRRLLSEDTLAQVHTPQVIIGDRPLTRLPAHGAYALGWCIEHYHGHRRISHGGYLHDAQSSLMFFPDVGLGIVSFTNFGCPTLSDFLNQRAFEIVMNLQPTQTIEQRLADYEARVQQVLDRNKTVVRATPARPSLALSAYAGTYRHAGYGAVTILRTGRDLVLRRYDLSLRLQHWHYDTWIARDANLWVIHQPHAFDRSCLLQFELGSDGSIKSLSIPFEPEVAPIRFMKQERRAALRGYGS